MIAAFSERVGQPGGKRYLEADGALNGRKDVPPRRVLLAAASHDCDQWPDLRDAHRICARKTQVARGIARLSLHLLGGRSSNIVPGIRTDEGNAV
ncbi:hypothetical protein GXW78_03540 [Roseomonas terrae]|uniref:Uncharacterized protein n=1 Tax=Neoroseomonas terrae TaxID=424799 RepID=A0ABS5ECI0_9PROT|nr:hypothetical protein [Neoroseomonas terrae]MBR0648720.1 hypothetical protein [Neoroseomonas terrae]